MHGTRWDEVQLGKRKETLHSEGCQALEKMPTKWVQFVFLEALKTQPDEALRNLCFIKQKTDWKSCEILSSLIFL